MNAPEVPEAQRHHFNPKTWRCEFCDRSLEDLLHNDVRLCVGRPAIREGTDASDDEGPEAKTGGHSDW